MIPHKCINVFGAVFFLFSCCFYLNGQTVAVENTVYSFFPKQKKIHWLEHFEGKVNGVNNISIALAYDGKSCKGLFTYQKSGERLRLDGVLNGNELTLLEVDQNGAVTGEFEGYIEGENLYLTWSNFDNSLGSELFLTKSSNNKKSQDIENNSNWVNKYEGAIFENKVVFYLQKIGLDDLIGVAYFDEENKTYNLSGEVFDFKNIKLTIKDDKGKIKGKVEGIFEKDYHILANYFSAKGQRFPVFLHNQTSFEIQYKEFADYISNYDISFPKTQNYSFNRWMNNLTDQWIENCRQHIFKVEKVSNQIKKPAMRSSVRAYAWSEVDYFDDQIISGYLTFENTWTDELSVRSFNFDFRTGKEITLNDLFEAGFDYNNFVVDFLNKEIDQHDLYNDFSFRKWLSEQSFSDFLIHKDGIAFCTGYNKIYGRQKVKIRYEDLKPYLNEDNVLNYLINPPNVLMVKEEKNNN